MRCRKCGEKACINMRQHKLALCKTHFLDWIPEQVEHEARAVQARLREWQAREGAHLQVELRQVAGVHAVVAAVVEGLLAIGLPPTNIIMMGSMIEVRPFCPAEPPPGRIRSVPSGRSTSS